MLRKNEAKSRKEISFKAFNNLYISKIKEEDDISSDGDNTPQSVDKLIPFISIKITEGKGKYKGNIPLTKCFNCGVIG